MLPMLQCYPEKRLLADQMLKHPWLYKKSSDYILYYFNLTLGIIKLMRK